MNRYQRVAAALSRRPVDRVPVSAWGHFFTRELDARSFSDATVEFVEAYDWDFLKVHPRACYHVEGWGFRYEPSRDPAHDHRCVGHPIDSVGAWRRLRPLPLDCPPLAEQLSAVGMLRERLGDRLPIIMTVFSPLDVAEKLVDRNTALLKQYLEQDPSAIEPALAAIAETFVAFVRALVDAGIDGLYFSTQWASDDRMRASTYRDLVRPFDLAVLEPARGLWFNVLHLCGSNVQLDAMIDYPVQVVHWDVYARGNPTLRAGLQRTQKAVAGGVSVVQLATGQPSEIEASVLDCIAATGGFGLLIGPGCSIEVARTSRENLLAMSGASQRAGSVCTD